MATGSPIGLQGMGAAVAVRENLGEVMKFQYPDGNVLGKTLT